MSSQLRPSLLHIGFGFPSFRPSRDEALEHLLAGRHTLVVMPTGAGESLIYQLATSPGSGAPHIPLPDIDCEWLVGRIVWQTVTAPQPESGPEQLGLLIT